MVERQMTIPEAVIFVANSGVDPENFSVLELIEEVIHTYPELANSKDEVIEFCSIFLTHFPAALDYVALGNLLELFGITKRVLTHEYVLFWQGLLIEAASLGFPSVGAALELAQREVNISFGMNVTDLRIILAFRIYIADLLLQSHEKRKKELSELAGIVTSMVSEGSLDEDTIEEVARVLLALFGIMPSASNGIVDAKVDHYPLQLSTAKKTYSRNLSPFVYIPDMEAAGILVKLGKDIFNREPKSNQTLTFGAVGKMTAKQAEALFPDIFDIRKKVSTAHMQWVETALGMPYESIRDLFKDLFP